jgi:hypothetical protein
MSLDRKFWSNDDNPQALKQGKNLNKRITIPETSKVQMKVSGRVPINKSTYHYLEEIQGQFLRTVN